MSYSNQLSQSSAHKKHLIWLLPLLAVFALVILLKASGNGQANKAAIEPNKQQVNVMPIEWHEQYIQKSLVVGRIEAPQTAAIGFDMAGSVVELLVDEGQAVVSGQLLAQLDDQRLVAQMNELSASLNRAKSEATLAELSLARVVELVDRQLESAQRLDEARESVNRNRALVDEVLARQASVQVELGKTKLLAPFDGDVVSRLVDKGTVVNAGQTVLNLQLSAQLEARFALSADHANKFEQDQILPLTVNNQQVSARVKSIAQQRRLDTGTVDLIVDLTGQHGSTLPGDLVQVEISRQVHAQGFWVPRKALVSGVRGLWSLFTVVTLGGESQLQAKLVEIIHADDNQAFVRGALHYGELVVIEGMQRLVPGQRVTVAGNAGTSTTLSKP